MMVTVDLADITQQEHRHRFILVTRVGFIGLHKAFDTVIVHTEITGVEHEWCQTYLTGTSESGCVDSHLSDSLLVSVRVPHGSTLGSLLFLSLNLPSVIETCLLTNMFIDNTGLYLS